MAEDIKSPQFPESIFEGTLSNWLKKTGDAIKQDEVLAEIETDKVVIEVTAASDGVMGEIIVSEGETIESSQLIGNYTKGATTAKEKPKAEIKEEKKLSASAPKEIPKPKKETAPKQVETKADTKMQDNENFRMGPAAKKLLNEKNLEISSLKPSTKKGVVTKEDVIKASEPAKQKEDTAQTEILGSSKRVPMTRLRSVVAKRLLESQSQTASLTTFNEVDLFEVKKLREKYRGSFEEKFGVKLGFMGMFMKASSIALQEMPIVNASIDGDDIVYHGHQDIGVAVSSERGLVVPVVRNVSELSISEIEIAIRDYSIKAREGKLGMEDITGGTFTISNGGVFGSLLSTPILNPPQSAILGMHKIQDRPMVVDGKIEIRPMMYLALTYDHRLLDGKDAVSFLVKIKESLEAPESMILGV
jgi:2-oxoglutarate dehydrogenase E2 component (dihydrolipoamide succinyltransferase)